MTTAEREEREGRREYRTFITDTRRWESFTARADDIFVCTPAKCGTTWMQTIVAALLFEGDAPGAVMELAPWLDARYEPIDSMIERLDAQTHRRSVKTHTNADGIPWHPTVSYIVVGRDGRDAFMSFHNTCPTCDLSSSWISRSAHSTMASTCRTPPRLRSTTFTSSSPGGSTMRPCGSSMSHPSGVTEANPTCCSCTTTTCSKTSTARCAASRRS